MKKYFNVSFQYSENVYCANIAHAESAEAVEAHYSAKYEWCKVSEATVADVEEAKRRGKPIIEIESAKKAKKKQKEQTKHESKTAWSTAHAWAIVNELFPGDYSRDEISSERAGYPIYRATSEGSRAYICDLNSALEINYDDGSSQRITIDRDALEAEHRQAEQAEALAREIEQRKAAEDAARKADEARALVQGELEDAREALADMEAEQENMSKRTLEAEQRVEDMEAEAQKLAAEVMRLKARLFDLLEAQQGRIA